MSLRSDIEDNYLDSNGLVAPARCPPGAHNPSGNGICYTGEYMVLLRLLGEMDARLETDFFHSISNCFVEPGLLERGILWTGEQESVDDYYGFAAGCVATDHPELAEMVVDYGWAHFGSFNDRTPGKWTLVSWLWRQPQLVFALYAAAGRAPKWYNPLTWWLYPLEVYTAAIIATSCTRADARDWDARRLSWLLIHTVSPVSLLCRLASSSWYSRLFRTYPRGMKDVAGGYYQPGHPFIEHWATR